MSIPKSFKEMISNHKDLSLEIPSEFNINKGLKADEWISDPSSLKLRVRTKGMKEANHYSLFNKSGKKGHSLITPVF
jgi:hypothetical protein